MARIIIEASDVWEYFIENMDELSTKMEMIAENQECGVEIFVSESYSLPLITVSVDSEIVNESIAMNMTDCFNTVREIYEKYISNTVMDAILEEDEEYNTAMQLELIDEREEEIDTAIYTFLLSLVPNLFEATDDPDEICEELKEHICELLYTRYDISIYRPMYLEDEDGTDVFEEYPYSEMEFD